MNERRFVVWSPDAAACMIWSDRAKAERFAAFWNESVLLGCANWRVSLVREAIERDRDLDAPVSTPVPSREAPALAVAPSRMPALQQVTGGRPGRPRPDDASASGVHCLPTEVVDEHVTMLAAKDALIDQLQKKLNEYVLMSVREAATLNNRIAELEARLQAWQRRGLRSVS